MPDQGPPMRISVIVPALNEEACIADTVRSVRSQRPHQIIVVDGGSHDATREKAAKADLVLETASSRARQMNLGAEHATGDLLVFLHADCSLGPGAFEAVRQCLRLPGVVAGCFRQTVQESSWLYRCIEACAEARVRLTGMAYGDQGLFLRREVFAHCGGFPPVRFMEDVLICRRLRRGGRIVVADKRILVSPRRWRRAGIIRQTLRNWTLTALVAAGVSPDRLASFYPAVR